MALTYSVDLVKQAKPAQLADVQPSECTAIGCSTIRGLRRRAGCSFGLPLLPPSPLLPTAVAFVLHRPACHIFPLVIPFLKILALSLAFFSLHKAHFLTRTYPAHTFFFALIAGPINPDISTLVNRSSSLLLARALPQFLNSYFVVFCPAGPLPFFLLLRVLPSERLLSSPLTTTINNTTDTKGRSSHAPTSATPKAPGFLLLPLLLLS